MPAPIRIGMVAGESSGDILGADLIRHLKSHFPNAQFEGIGGTQMISEGFDSFFPLERLSVMGFIEPLKRLPELLHIRRTLIQHFLRQPPAVFIGIDAPDFTLSIEKRLKKSGIKTAHYVSPTVWAWRKGRIHGIKKSIDLMLTLFPFEASLYAEHQIPVAFVGHPLADHIPFTTDPTASRQELGLPLTGRMIAILPGSRSQELKYLAPTFIKTAMLLKEQQPDLQFITAFPNQERTDQFQSIRQSMTDLPIPSFLGKAKTVMGASDAILIVSGTGSLEAALVKRPTVVAYKMSPMTYWLARKLIKVPYIAMPNILANQQIIPEYIQDQATPETLAHALLSQLEIAYDTQKFCEPLMKIHQELKQNAGQTGAMAIRQLIQSSSII